MTNSNSFVTVEIISPSFHSKALIPIRNLPDNAGMTVNKPVVLSRLKVEISPNWFCSLKNIVSLLVIISVQTTVSNGGGWLILIIGPSLCPAAKGVKGS